MHRVMVIHLTLLLEGVGSFCLSIAINISLDASVTRDKRYFLIGKNFHMHACFIKVPSIHNFLSAVLWMVFSCVFK